MKRTYQVIFTDNTVAQIAAKDVSCFAGAAFVCFLDDKGLTIAAYPAQRIFAVELMVENRGLAVLQKPN